MEGSFDSRGAMSACALNDSLTSLRFNECNDAPAVHDNDLGISQFVNCSMKFRANKVTFNGKFPWITSGPDRSHLSLLYNFHSNTNETQFQLIIFPPQFFQND